MKLWLFLFWASVFLIGYTYWVYYAILLLISHWQTRMRKNALGYTPSVSILVCAYNERKIIEEKIKNFLALDYPKQKIELIIGSDHSTDGTDAIVQRYAKKYPNIRLYSFPVREGKANGINKVAPHAQGEILIFSDANTLYHPDAVRKLVSHFIGPQVGGVCGELVLLPPDENPGGAGESLYWKYENRIKKLEGKIKTVFGATGGIYAIRKSLFKPLPPHQTNISDDFLIPMEVVAQGFDVVYEEKAKAWEYASKTMKDEFLRKVRIGAADLYALKRIYPLLHPRHGFVAFGLWSHKIIRWSVPVLMLLALIANGFLLSIPLYRWIFLLQLGFYFLAFWGWISDLMHWRLRMFSILYYFLVVHVGLMVGYWKYFTKTIRPTWTRLER